MCHCKIRQQACRDFLCMSQDWKTLPDQDEGLPAHMHMKDFLYRRLSMLNVHRGGRQAMVQVDRSAVQGRGCQ